MFFKMNDAANVEWQRARFQLERYADRALIMISAEELFVLDPTAFGTAGGTEDLNIDQFLKVVMISGDEVTQRAATFDIQELVIVDHVLTAAQASIAKYFWLEWHG